MRQVVVTGGGTGIGRAAAAWFAARGDAVTIVGRRKDVLDQAAAGTGATAVVCDLTSPDEIESALPHFPDRVDVLVNNAGGNTDLSVPAGGGGDGSQLSHVAQRWRANFDANVLTAVLMTTALDSRLNDGARVITIGSIAAKTGATSYGAAKAALEGWNVSLATSLGPRGITANVVSPGLTMDTEFFQGKLSDERYERLVAATRTGRPGSPDDIVAAIGFLASTEAGHVTSQVIHVNGGAYSGH
ncbi:SDR family NAD(P)-dependent oxidoreductase [Phytoactinopolyspora halotolerans]|uniref:SDR family oxidoreductase n=1 Tax=Phytoactinopolyspora halotolerans TaxID=1981512 RepID=A0A6L9S1N2_9ACTN|nr:SDR family oxidoreductase [Phytoactinopolyspora halotolerans]NED99105.1 SDR family oxidoreductase [Phytoactinopolyspora halotolerans]